MNKAQRRCPTCPNERKVLAEATETLVSCCAEVDAKATALYCSKCKSYSVDIRKP